MAISPLTLAALATSAVPDLDVEGYRLLDSGHSRELSAVLDTSHGMVLIQLPTSPAAEVHHSAKLMGQAALTPGVRAALPFAAPEVLGMTRSGDTRAIVSTFLEGHRFDVEELDPRDALIPSFAECLSAIHALPFTVVTSQGLPNRSASEVRAEASRLVERSYATGLVPETVFQYWSHLLQDQQMWDFQPCVTHGTLGDDTLLVDGDAVSAVLDWSQLAVDDPARDLGWLSGGPDGLLEAVLDVYLEVNSRLSRGALAMRARFWHELGIATWLLHGIESHDQSVVDDAVELFDRLVPRAARALTQENNESSSLSAEDVLEQTPPVEHSLSQTDQIDALDDDRVFEADPDFDSDPDETKPVDPLEPRP